MGSLLQRLVAAPVVGGHPGLDGASTTAQAAGDADGGVALLGQDDRLDAGPSPGVSSLPGQLLQPLQGVAILDVHRRLPRSICARKFSSITTKLQALGSANFFSVPYSMVRGRQRPSPKGDGLSQYRDAGR